MRKVWLPKHVAHRHLSELIGSNDEIPDYELLSLLQVISVQFLS